MKYAIRRCLQRRRYLQSKHADTYLGMLRDNAEANSSDVVKSAIAETYRCTEAAAI